jgi:hypothetical protein
VLGNLGGQISAVWLLQRVLDIALLAMPDRRDPWRGSSACK